jgi:hypothetical protein
VEWIPLYDGPTVLADMLREELRERGIPSIIQATGPFLGIIGDAARSPFSLLLIPEIEMERRREQVAECVSLVLPDAAQAILSPGKEASDESSA